MLTKNPHFMVHPIIFGRTLVKCREWYGLSQKDVGRLLGVTTQAVSKWELGNSTPDITTLWMLGEIFFIDIKNLLTFNENDFNNLYFGKKDFNYCIKRDEQYNTSPRSTSAIHRTFFFDYEINNHLVKDVKTKECIFIDAKFSNVNLVNSDITCTNFTTSTFNKIIIENSKLSLMRMIMNVESTECKNCVVDSCIFTDENFKNGKLLNTEIVKCSFNKCTLNNYSFTKSKINNSIFFHTFFYNCIFDNCEINDNIYRNCQLIDCTFDKLTYEKLKDSNITIIRPTIK